MNKLSERKIDWIFECLQHRLYSDNSGDNDMRLALLYKADRIVIDESFEEVETKTAEEVQKERTHDALCEKSEEVE